MIGKVLAGVALAWTVATSAVAAGPLQISTNFPYPLTSVDPYKADLATLGVTFGLDNPVGVFPTGPTKLVFKLLDSHTDSSGYQVFSLDLGGVSHAVPLQAFSGTGTVLATVTTAQSFNNFVGITDTFGPEPASFIWGLFPAYLSDADTAALTGIGPYIGNVSKLYFNAGDHALFEVDVATGVPEPAVWGLLVAGFGLVGAQLRRRRLAATWPRSPTPFQPHR
ncbi:MAG: hypothetical protein JWO83_4534 [Caulobacteraceae bacterium]|jgi:hypothetical protein|nr:hypothetical protein [Caulobacteraceae bacterium]